MATLLEPERRVELQTSAVPGLAVRLPRSTEFDPQARSLEITLRTNGAEHRCRSTPAPRCSMRCASGSA